MSSPRQVASLAALADYAGKLVDGARILALFGDAATELLIRLDGDEGLFRAYESLRGRLAHMA